MLLALMMMVQAAGPVAVERPVEVSDRIRPPITRAADGGTPPRLTNQDAIFNPKTYPFWAQNLEVEGRVRVSLEVGADGKAGACAILSSSGSTEIDQGTCQLLIVDGRFAPARDRRGRAVAGRFVRQIVWQLEARRPLPFVDSFVRTVFTIDAEGRVVGCGFETSPDVTERDFDRRMCAEFAGVPAMFAAMLGERVDWTSQSFVMETRQATGDGAAARAAGSGPGATQIDRVVTRAVIDPAGRITACQIIETGMTSRSEVEQGCAKMLLESFEPAAAPGAGERAMTFATTIYVRKK